MRAHNINAEELLINSQNMSPTIGKNALINGGFDIWQRGTSFSTAVTTADRWKLGLTGETATVSRQTFTAGQTDVPGNPKYYLRAAVTTGGANATYLAILTQYIEGVQTYAGETVTISFYAKASSGTPDIVTEFAQAFGTSGSDNVYTLCGTHTLSTSWQKFEVQFDVPSISGKTIGTAEDALVFVFWFSAGSNYNARTGSLGQQSITCDIAQVQVEKGTVATDFERRHIGHELALCQRYYEKSYSIETPPGTASSNGCDFLRASSGLGVGSGVKSTKFKVTKRTTPTVKIYSTDSGTIDNFFVYGVGDKDATSGSIGDSGFVMQANESSAATDGQGIYWQWTSDAEF